MEIQIFWHHVFDEDRIEKLFSSGAELWLTLHEVLTNERFVSLRKVFLDLALGGLEGCPNPEYKNLALSYVNNLFPKARKGQQVEIIYV